jgi:hypothetical protein
MRIISKIFFLFILSVLFLASCTKEDPPPDPGEDTGNVVLKFAHYANGSPLQKDTMIYTNAAGNQFEVDEVKYFISDVQFHKSGGTIINVDDSQWAFYVDNDIASTLTWNISDKLPVGTYDSISFRFGIINSKNISYMFVNPPEVYMEWPDVLGGGYHCMMLNGKWLDSLSQIENFNTHLGKGMEISGNDTTFIDNSFHVKLANSDFTLSKDATKEIQIIMNIESWYDTPYVYDHNHFGQAIMMNQAAMHMISANGFDVFSVGYIH